jgi:hypothetical protein
MDSSNQRRRVTSRAAGNEIMPAMLRIAAGQQPEEASENTHAGLSPAEPDL